MATYHLPYYRASQIPRRIKLLSFNNILPVSCTTPPTVQSGEQDDTKSLSWPGSCHERTERAGRQEGDFYSSPTVIIQDLLREIYLKERLIVEF